MPAKSALMQCCLFFCLARLRKSFALGVRVRLWQIPDYTFARLAWSGITDRATEIERCAARHAPKCTPFAAAFKSRRSRNPLVFVWFGWKRFISLILTMDVEKLGIEHRRRSVAEGYQHFVAHEIDIPDDRDHSSEFTEAKLHCPSGSAHSVRFFDGH
jgi:hypothetical protein